MLTKEEAVRQHRELWRWIAVETLRQRRFVTKHEYFDNKPYVLHRCYCCEFCFWFTHRADRCELCPIDWSSNANFVKCVDKERYNDENNLYGLWTNTENYKEAALLAYKISKLPEKEFRFVMGESILTETQLRDYYTQSPDLAESYSTWEDWIYDLLKDEMIRVK